MSDFGDLEKARQRFLTMEAASRDVILLRRAYVVMAGNKLADALLLAQIVFWHLPNSRGQSKLRVRKGGHWWIAKADLEWWDEIALPASTARDARRRLQKRELIVVEHHRFNGLRTCHIRLNWPQFLQAYEVATRQLYGDNPPVERISSDRRNGSRLTERTDPVRPVTETTTEKTTESDDALRNSLLEIGFTGSQLRPFLNRISKERVEEVLLWALEGVKKGKVDSPAAWLRKAIEDDYPEPAWLGVSESERARRRYRQGEFADFWDA